MASSGSGGTGIFGGASKSVLLSPADSWAKMRDEELQRAVGSNCESLALTHQDTTAILKELAGRQTASSRKSLGPDDSQQAELTQNLLLPMERLVSQMATSTAANLTHNTGVLERLTSEMAQMRKCSLEAQDGAAKLLAELRRTNQLLSLALIKFDAHSPGGRLDLNVSSHPYPEFQYRRDKLKSASAAAKSGCADIDAILETM